MSDRLKALKERDSYEFWQTDDVRCPHCGNCIRPEDHDMWRLYSEGEHEIDCPYCDLSMEVRVDVKWSFTTESQPDDQG